MNVTLRPTCEWPKSCSHVASVSVMTDEGEFQYCPIHATEAILPLAQEQWHRIASDGQQVPQQ